MTRTAPPSRPSRRIPNERLFPRPPHPIPAFLEGPFLPRERSASNGPGEGSRPAGRSGWYGARSNAKAKPTYGRIATGPGLTEFFAASLFEDAGADHVALVYRDPGYLARAVAQWSSPALRGGGGAILVGTAPHAMDIRGALRRQGVDVEGLERNGRLVFVDAEWLMAHFILDGTPDAGRFRSLSAEIVRGVRAKAGARAPVRAWGEMVSLLRLRGKPAAAHRLEELWTEVIAEHDIALLCSYDSAHGESGAEEGLARIRALHPHVLVEPEAPRIGTY